MMDEGLQGNMQNVGEGEENTEGKLCRDFMRNVCNRGKNCRFVHPPDVKIKTDPIFCHDYQQNKCFRATCKFIHCTREEEEHYKSTGELPEELSAEYYSAPRPTGAPRGGKMGRGGGRGGGGGRANWIDNDDPSIPLCKDYLKGVCDRPPGGCKFRHAEVGVSRGYGAAAAAGVAGRRRIGESAYYGQGPTAKRAFEGYASDGRLNEYEDFYSPEYSNPPPPPPPTAYPAAAPRADPYGRNGYGATTMSSDTSQLLNSYTSATAMKAMEDENFMLKRRIEELKKQVSDLVATNEYLLSQNATLRLTNMNTINMQKETPSPGMDHVITPSMTVTSQMSTLPSVSMVITPSMAATAPQITLPVSMGLTSSITAAAVSQMSTLPTMSLAP